MFIKTIHSSAIKTTALLAVILLAGGTLLIWPQAVTGGVSRGLSICSSVLIPSLFPFLVLAGFLVRSGVSQSLGRRLERPVRAVFGLPGCCAGGILVGFIGGYPAGALAVGELVRRGAINTADGRRMLRFCVNAGPAFVISAVGANLLGSTRAGVILFAAHLLASLLLGILSGRIEDRHAAEESTAAVRREPPLPPAAAFVESVHVACQSLLSMCGFVVLFAALLAICDVSGITAFVNAFLTWPFRHAGMDASALACLFPSLLEVSCGCVEAAGAGPLAPLLLGLAMGWGGLSVHGQIAATLRGQGLVTRGFFAFRAAHALLGGVLSAVLFRLIPQPLSVFSPLSDAVLRPYATSAVASVALLLMCTLLLFATSDRQDTE